jgi:hypothetical protein
MQNIKEIYESLVLQKFPNASEVDIKEIKQKGAIDWMFEHQTVEAEIFDKFVMMKKLLGIETKEED